MTETNPAKRWVAEWGSCVMHDDIWMGPFATNTLYWWTLRNSAISSRGAST